MKFNAFTNNQKFTFEGAPSQQVKPIDTLRRITLACLLWEDNFYIDGKKSAELIEKICQQLHAEDIIIVAMEANANHLRHIPLFLIVEALKRPKKISTTPVIRDAITAVCSRPDQMTELVALYWRDGKKTLPRQMILGLRKAFRKFDEYQLAKYNRNTPVKLRDVAFLIHLKAGKNKKRGRLWANVINKDFFPQKTKSGFEVAKHYRLKGKPKLKTPDTWEVRLSSGADKKESFIQLLDNKKLGYLALVRNLRNMCHSGVPKEKVAEALQANNRAIFPYQFLIAAKACPHWEDIIDSAMIASAKKYDALTGSTILLVDVSGSMTGLLSKKGEATRNDAACGLAVLLREICSQIHVFSFSEHLAAVPNRAGMALRDAIQRSQPNSGTNLQHALVTLNRLIEATQTTIDRLIVVTDEQYQSAITILPRVKFGYVLNVGAYQNGVFINNSWHTITGFSENVIDYIRQVEKQHDTR